MLPAAGAGPCVLLPGFQRRRSVLLPGRSPVSRPASWPWDQHFITARCVTHTSAEAPPSVGGRARGSQAEHREPGSSFP